MDPARLTATTFTFAAMIGCFAVMPTHARQQLTWTDLVNRMTDLEYLATLPARGETSAMFSSYDRNSRYNEMADRYIDWDHNLDGDGYIRREGDEIVMAEMEGPGVVWRIWSAHVRTGYIRIYIDGEQAIQMPFAGLFDGATAPFNYPQLAYQTPIAEGDFADRHDFGGGRNLYFPIPYQTSCKIVAGPDWGRYFQISYTTFPEGTRVPSFTGRLPGEAQQALSRLNNWFADNLGENPRPARPEAETIDRTLTVEPGQTATVADLTGARAITALRVRVPEMDRQTQMRVMRHLAIQMRWDDKAQPAVWSPVGDFFGTAPGVNPCKALITGVTDEGMYSYWYMPFAARGIIELINEDHQAHELAFQIQHEPLPNGFDGLAHFHAKWHRGGFPVRKDRWPDWLVLTTGGAGRFVGMNLHVWNPIWGAAPHEVAYPGHYWWGEGDEKFHVDGEKFPSTFGTGTEDYFGYAWCDPEPFVYPFHAQPYSENNAGHQFMLRCQVAENVPFQKSFEAYMEKYFPDEYPCLFATVAYWYLSPDGKDPHKPVAVEERHDYYVEPEISAGGYRVQSGFGGSVSTQNMSGFRGGRWTNDSQLWWQLAKVGDRLDILFPAQRAGRYEVSTVLTRSFNYAIVQLYVNGRKAGEPIDLFNPNVINTDPISLGVHELVEGDNTLTVEIVGTNPSAQPGLMFGLDQIIVKKD